MRDSIDNGTQVKSHVRVSVRFKNGNKLVGVVKDGRFVERVDGLRFVDAQAKDRGAGIRLWYTSGVRNYVFVPFADFADYQVLQRLTPKQLEEMEHEMQLQEGRHAEREAESARNAAAAKARELEQHTVEVPVEAPPVTDAPPAPGQEPAKGKNTDGKNGGDKKADVVSEEQRLWFSLLQSYPPAAGWGQAKRDEISRRMVVIGSKPSESELKFVEQFAEWERACKHFGVAADSPPSDQPAPEPETKGRKKAASTNEPAPESEATPESKPEPKPAKKSKKK